MRTDHHPLERASDRESGSEAGRDRVLRAVALAVVGGYPREVAAKELRVSPTTISRLIARARELGVIETVAAEYRSLVADHARSLRRERQLLGVYSRFGLKKAVVVDAPSYNSGEEPPLEARLRLIGSQVASFLEALLSEFGESTPTVIATSFGKHLLAVAEQVRSARTYRNLIVVPTLGANAVKPPANEARVDLRRSPFRHEEDDANTIAAKLASGLGAHQRCLTLSLPGLLPPKATETETALEVTRALIWDEPSHRLVFGRREDWVKGTPTGLMAHAMAVLMGVGTPRDPAWHRLTNQLTADEREVIRRMCGDLNVHPFADSKEAGDETAALRQMRERIVGLNLEQLKWLGAHNVEYEWIDEAGARRSVSRPRHIVGVCSGGEDKARASHVALKHGFFNAFFCDSYTAELMLGFAAEDGLTEQVQEGAPRAANNS